MRQNSNQTKHLPTLLVQQIRLQWIAVHDRARGNLKIESIEADGLIVT